MNGAPTKRELLAMLDDVTKQRNELQLLLCACVARAGGEVTLGGGLLRGLMERHRDVTLAPDGDGFRVTLDLTAIEPEEHHPCGCERGCKMCGNETHEAVQ